jgi:hypothetical protein
MEKQKEISAKEREELMEILKTRFQKHMYRHKNLDWDEVAERLGSFKEKLWSLHEMEKSGGEPDVVGKDSATGEYIFFDCSAESPKGRRSVCYDREGLESRKQHKPKNNAIDMAAAMGIELFSEEQYRELQTLGKFDEKTSSWIQTPAAIRNLGGALFCDRRYEQVFVYHNGAQSYYASRGFRGSLKIFFLAGIPHLINPGILCKTNTFGWYLLFSGESSLRCYCNHVCNLCYCAKEGERLPLHQIK